VALALFTLKVLGLEHLGLVLAIKSSITTLDFVLNGGVPEWSDLNRCSACAYRQVELSARY